jgi:hypothetical protein
MYANGLDVLSPWANWEVGFHSSQPNPYRNLDRERPKEPFNNRKNKYKIRIMWKEYCDEWTPWFTPKILPNCNYTYYGKETEERRAYHVFRQNLTSEEFNTRWA